MGVVSEKNTVTWALLSRFIVARSMYLLMVFAVSLTSFINSSKPFLTVLFVTNNSSLKSI